MQSQIKTPMAKQEAENKCFIIKIKSSHFHYFLKLYWYEVVPQPIEKVKPIDDY